MIQCLDEVWHFRWTSDCHRSPFSNNFAEVGHFMHFMHFMHRLIVTCHPPMSTLWQFHLLVPDMDKQKLIFKDMLSVEKFSFLLQTFTTLFYVHKKGKIRLGAWYYSSVWIQNLWLNCHTCAVVGMQLHALQSNLRVLQIIVFRVRLSCPWRKTDQSI